MTNYAKSNTGFKILSTILKPVFKFWYGPKIIGKENIPENGAIVVACNHKHLMDQCMVIVSTKRPIHYMAKSEYFENKKVAWFFKAAGCIPVGVSGDYKFRPKNLVARIGEPIDVSDMDLEAANEKLHKAVENLILENLKEGNGSEQDFERAKHSRLIEN